MEYGDFDITVRVENGRFKARVARFDRRHFTLPFMTADGTPEGGARPNMPRAHADTPVSYWSEEDAIANAKRIADQARV